MELTFVRRDPDKGYFDRQLWLPKKHVNVISVKAGLEFPVMDSEGMSWIQLWEDAGDHIIVPREFIPRDHYDELSFPIISTRPRRFPKVRFKSKIILDFKAPEKDVQRQAFTNMCQAPSGVLHLSCGQGKTNIALHHIASRKVPAIVIVNNTTLINQWQNRIATFLDVGGGVGVVQGPPDTWDWEGKGIVLAMLHTVCLRHEELPVGFDRYFGGVYFDEVHHLSASMFVRAAPLFYGDRFGLTATVSREDGLEGIYQYHVGPVFFRYLQQDLKPRVYFQISPVQVNVQDGAVRAQVVDKSGKLNMPKLRSYLGALPENNQFIAEKIREPLAAGRKVLVLSHSVTQLQLLNEMFESSGLCTGKEAPANRITTLRDKQVTFGTLQLVREALDEVTLDTLFFLTPFGSGDVSGGGKNTLQQGMGRILRTLSGKKTPVVTIIDYVNIPKFHKMCRRLKQLLHDWPVDEGGPFDYEVVRPYVTEAQ